MSKIKKYVLLFAGLVTAFTGFTSCKSDALEEIDSDPNEQETLGEAIKAQFTISIPMAQGTVTRQSDAIVQASEDITGFRGINEIKLYPSADASFTKDSKLIGRNIALTNLMIPSISYSNTVDNYIPDGKLTSTSNSVIFGDVQLQIGTRTFLFYGKAIGSAWNEKTSSYTVDQKFNYGSLVANGLDDLLSDVSGIGFALDPIVTDKTASNTKRSKICQYLGSIAGTDGWSSSENKGFKDLYTKFTTMKAGASKNLEAAVKDLYFSLIGNTSDLAQAICKNICSGTPNETTGVAEDDNVKVTNNSTTKTLEFKSTLAGYPSETDNLPDGAAVLSWSGSTPSTPTYDIDENAFNGEEQMSVSKITNYVYPASLYYWGSSTIGTSDESQEGLYKKGYTWDEIVNATVTVGETTTKVFSGDAITTKTRSVVLKSPVQYAVGRFDISVVATPSGTDVTKLPDSGKGKDAHQIDPSKIKLTGVLIGGQKAVDWQFLTKKSAAEYTIFDNILKSKNDEGVGLSSSATDFINRTLVLETYGKDGDTYESVNVALEFLNDDQDFYGFNGGIIPKGTKFYLVAKLDTKPASLSTEEFNKTGGKVFKQDFVTIAKFAIANLTKAYNYIPDLRNPAVELGLSVDLDWQEGITFEHTFN